MGGYGRRKPKQEEPKPCVAPGTYSNGSATRARERAAAIRAERERKWRAEIPNEREAFLADIERAAKIDSEWQNEVLACSYFQPTGPVCRTCRAKAACEAHGVETCEAAMLLDVAERARAIGAAEAVEKAKPPRLKKLERDPEDPRHGTVTGHSAGCRCELCNAAWSDYLREYRAGRRG